MPEQIDEQVARQALLVEADPRYISRGTHIRDLEHAIMEALELLDPLVSNPDCLAVYRVLDSVVGKDSREHS